MPAQPDLISLDRYLRAQTPTNPVFYSIFHVNLVRRNRVSSNRISNHARTV